MSLFSKLFGGSSSAPTKKDIKPVLYEGFQIFPEPIKEGGGYRIAARIEMDVDGETKTHQLIRADTMQSETEAQDVSLSKAKLVIDQMGVGIFNQ